MSQELITSQYLASSSQPEQGGTTRSPKERFPGAAIAVGILILLVATAVWVMAPGDSKSNRAADFFLQLVGSDLTWEQYQQQQRAQGNQRLDENEYDWTQQLMNDAYAR
jgi:hypothetical protein